MFDSIKAKLWELLKGKEVSLAMMYNHNGDILWSKGREIWGRSVHESSGFARSYVIESLKKPTKIEEEDIILTSQADELSKSANILEIKSLIIQPVSEHYFLYVDSGAKESFTTADREVFKVIGELLGEMIIQVRQSQQKLEGIAGHSQTIEEIRELILQYSLEEEALLLLGETGVGKSRIAELIHRYSGRKGKFITVNTPSIPETLFESEVFGHKKGAFTDAKFDKKGFVTEAEGGTLFFDEISEIPPGFQAKLLRLIETKKFVILGEASEREANVRFITATNQDLSKAVEKKEFREDLYYRLQVLEIEIPPLRNRGEDIRALVEDNLELLRGKEIGEGFWDALLNHQWPGNVRELITVLTRLGIHSGDPVTAKEIQQTLSQSRFKKGLTGSQTEIESIWRQIESGKTFWDGPWKSFINRDLNRREMRQLLTEGYQKSNYSLKRLSQALNIKDNEFKRFIATLHKYRIHPAKEQ